jgi:predicted nucleic acid-binding protein
VVVVDASAWAAVIFAEPEAADVVDALGDKFLSAPAILHFELTNIARTKTRQKPSDAAAIRDSLADGLSRAVAIEAVDFVAVLALALETGLSAYDASYLWLSRYLDAPLITLDRKLAAHAKDV